MAWNVSLLPLARSKGIIMSVSYSSYFPRVQQTRSEPDTTGTPGRLPIDFSASNVRPASTNLLAARMDALSLQVGRVACYGLE